MENAKIAVIFGISLSLGAAIQVTGFLMHNSILSISGTIIMVCGSCWMFFQVIRAKTRK
ncbi:hypothetical protein [Listeria booriae]|uniref:hypothetical protein n=1 Tax=Listeria booriae TaxID=1552123 RepID=UPI0016237A2C|nr:hypothetical protein [Listeria booriae]MBC1211009.1 hypothetical protein [Listeria booriae]MBC1233779.1 hypothetical protein [Listeria booriae]MBC1246027.1 hypothetical protein [Listeria booriae]MBC1307469.1 hypothetical protein [Listeria booriae]MBC1502791.1 hypothetical protein [Listeria booriae]